MNIKQDLKDNIFALETLKGSMISSEDINQVQKTFLDRVIINLYTVLESLEKQEENQWFSQQKLSNIYHSENNQNSRAKLQIVGKHSMLRMEN